MTKTRKSNYKHNATRKNKKQERQLTCFKSYNTHDQIEPDVEKQINYLYETHKHKKYDLNLIKIFHTPYAPSKITPQK